MASNRPSKDRTKGRTVGALQGSLLSAPRALRPTSARCDHSQCLGAPRSLIWQVEASLGVAHEPSLHGLLAWADAVVLCCPLTDETRGLIGSHELGLMRDGTLIVNVARGGVIDSDALAAALPRIHAALDVTDPEPLPPSHPLLAHGHGCLTLTPHMGTATARTRLKMTRLAVANLVAGIDGRPLPHAVPGSPESPAAAARAPPTRGAGSPGRFADDLRAPCADV
mmetsp:Transcript_91553/g.274901  ORF Transcript_91553/g.274901 Transcript_91553/m.274901 type:complete len:225 (+) Transcript_91553:616-1290(+)